MPPLDLTKLLLVVFSSRATLSKRSRSDGANRTLPIRISITPPVTVARARRANSSENAISPSFMAAAVYRLMATSVRFKEIPSQYRPLCKL